MTSHTNGPYASDATASNAGVYDTTEGLNYPQTWPITTTSQVAASAPFELAGPSNYAQTSSPYALDVAVDTSVPPGWTDNIGQRSEYVPLPASDRSVPQVPPFLGYHLAAQTRSDHSGQHGWRHCPPPVGNVPQVYGYPTPPQNNTSFSTGSTHTDIMFGAGRQDFNACDPVNNEEPVGNAPGGQEGLYYPLPVHDYPSQHQSDASLSGGSGYLHQCAKQKFLHRSDLVIRGQETGPTFPLQYRSFESDPAHMDARNYHTAMVQVVGSAGPPSKLNISITTTGWRGPPRPSHRQQMPIWMWRDPWRCSRVPYPLRPLQA
ncbi:hypothetical protein JB92DRAFT_3097733, partial [Gautieria morchelliformis]